MVASFSPHLCLSFRYADAVDLSKIDDPMLRNATEVQIANFGQCPAQLFTVPHPRRMTLSEALSAHWNVTMASALLTVRANAHARSMIEETQHRSPIVKILFVDLEPFKGQSVHPRERLSRTH